MRLILLLILAANGSICFADPPSIHGIDSASRSLGITPGSWISIYGRNLAPSSRLWQSSDFNGTALPLMLNGISVKVNGKAAPLSAVSEFQVNALVPLQAGLGDVSVTVTTPEGTSSPRNIELQSIAPGFFTIDSQGNTYVAARHANGSLVEFLEPAEPGEVISLYGSGFGPTVPFIDPLLTFNGVAPLVTPNDLAVKVGGIAAAVTFAGLTANGLYQLNIVVPPLAEGRYDVVATVGGVTSQGGVIWLRVVPPEGPPVITGMVPNDFIWGQRSYVTLTGTGLSVLRGLTVSDPSQLSVLSDYPTSLVLAVEPNATPGERTISVFSAKGQSNALPFTIRRGQPRISSILPGSVWPGRIYWGFRAKPNSVPG